MDKGYKIQEK